jgi:hypothetical protein
MAKTETERRKPRTVRNASAAAVRTADDDVAENSKKEGRDCWILIGFQLEKEME